MTRVGISMYEEPLKIAARLKEARTQDTQRLRSGTHTTRHVKKDAQRLSLCFEDLKNDIAGTLKQGITSGLAAW